MKSIRLSFAKMPFPIISEKNVFFSSLAKFKLNIPIDIAISGEALVFENISFQNVTYNKFSESINNELR